MTSKLFLESRPTDIQVAQALRVEIWDGTTFADRSADRDTWDSLWQRSRSTIAIVTPEAIARWCRRFAGRASLKTVVVSDRTSAGETRLLAALPLIAAKHLPMTTVGDLPSNPWFQCGDLLLDESPLGAPPIGGVSPMKLVLDKLIEGIRQLPWPLLWIPTVRIETMRWRLFTWALEQAGMAFDIRDRYESSRVRLAGDWETFQSGLSRNMRSQMKRMEKKLSGEGEIEFQFAAKHTPAQVDRIMDEMFQVEDHGWKGRNKSSILKVEGIADIYRAEARDLALRDRLRTAVLRVGGRPIACGFGYTVKGVLTLHKIGYDEAFARFRPGMLLIHKLIEACHADRTCEIVDFSGPIQDYHRRWHPTTYRMARLGVAINRRGTMMLQTIRKYHSIVDYGKKLPGTDDLGTGE